MKIGAIFPHIEIGADPGGVRAYAEAVEALGYSHIVAYDHVLVASAATYDAQKLSGPYREQHMFHEPFVLFGFLAAVTSRIELATGVLVLPQRQAALVAKQAAEVDVLARGRFRLGVGIGYNHVEYEAMGVPFRLRGPLQEEQVRLMRELWSKPVINFKGRFHTVSDAGINPRPPAGTIPVWFGGMSDPVLRRIARMGDGWFPQFPQIDGASARIPVTEQPEVLVERLRGYLREAGRDPSSISIAARLTYKGHGPDEWLRVLARYRDLGVTHVSINMMRCGMEGPDQHIAGLRRFSEAMNLRASDA